MYQVEARVGRLVEARIQGLRDLAEADEYSRVLARCIGGVAGPTAFLVADHRPVVIYPQAVTERLIELFRGMNARLARVVILTAASNATFTLQMQRLVREADNDARRVVHEDAAASAWMDPMLEPRERERLRAFLSEWTSKQRAGRG